MLFSKPSLVTRIAVGKMVGFVIGLSGFILLPMMIADISMMLRLAFLFWYITVGAVIGAFGVLTWHPVLKCSLPWWFRDPVIGAWMNFVLTLFMYDIFAAMMRQMLGGVLLSPFWFVLEGAIVGLIIGYFAKRHGGEGIETVMQR